MADGKPFAVKPDEIDQFETPHHEETRSRELVNPERGSEHVVFRLSTLEPGGQDHWHDHETSEQLIFVRSGTGVLEVKESDDDDEVIEYDLEPETFVFLPAGTPHHGKNTGDEPLDLIVVWAPPYESFDDWAPDE
jgi:mannose-6-phosphate isomerase-like protein (cupin superfamily)